MQFTVTSEKPGPLEIEKLLELLLEGERPVF